MIYLDSAATSLMRPQSVEYAMLDALRNMASPGRGGHVPAMKAAETVYACRCAAAEFFKADDAERILFTFNATHALNIAIKSIVCSGDRVLISGFEHNSVTRALRAAGAEIIVAGRKLFDPTDTIKSFERLVKQADAVVCTHVSNVFGYVLPIYEIAALCRKYNRPLIIDASQSAGMLPVDQSLLQADFIAMPGHKGLMGPQGTGILICGRTPAALLHGGTGSDSISQSMPDYMPDIGEAGTHNVCGIAGLKAGIDYIRARGLSSLLRHEISRKSLAVKMLSDCDALELFYADGELQTGVLSLRCKSIDCEYMASELAARGVCVRSGLHCAPLAHESAGTLDTGTVRLSFSPFTTAEETVMASRHIKSLCKRGKV